MTDLEAAIDGRLLGATDQFATSAHERERVAYHEAGHAILASVVPGIGPVQRISIAQQGPVTLGYTVQTPAEQRCASRKALLDQLAVLLGGAAAEEITFGKIAPGAQNDLQRASDLARTIVGDDFSPRKDDDLRTILVDAYGRAAEVLRVRGDALSAIARYLIDRGGIEGAVLRSLIDRYPAAATPVA